LFNSGHAFRVEFLKYYIRFSSVRLLDSLLAVAQQAKDLNVQRTEQHFLLRTNDEALWKDLFLYGQMLANAENEQIEAGQY
jgi:hypothetical protein